MALLPLFPGVPGGPELLVVLLLLVALFGVPIVVAFLGWQYLRNDDQLEALEARVGELESEVEADGDHATTGEHETEGDDSSSSRD